MVGVGWSPGAAWVPYSCCSLLPQRLMVQTRRTNSAVFGMWHTLELLTWLRRQDLARPNRPWSGFRSLPPTPTNLSGGARAVGAPANCWDSETGFLSLIFQLGFSGSKPLNYWEGVSYVWGRQKKKTKKQIHGANVAENWNKKKEKREAV